jgi:VWFA-related protein
MKPLGFLAILLLALFAFSMSGQDLVVDVNLRMLDVLVQDESGEPILDLTADDFEVMENGQPRSIKHFSLETEPVAVGFVVDTSSSIRPVKKNLDRAVRDILRKLHGDDQAFLTTFAGTDKLRVDLTTTHADILEAILSAKLGFGTRVYDAILDSLRYLSTKGLKRRVLIVLTDGADHYSNHSFDQVLQSAAFYAVPIYILGYVGDDSRTWSEEGRRDIRDQFEQLARATGGKTFLPGDATDFSSVAKQILQTVQYAYRLGFYSSGSFTESSDVVVKPRGGGLRRLVIRNSRPIS